MGWMQVSKGMVWGDAAQDVTGHFVDREILELPGSPLIYDDDLDETNRMLTEGERQAIFKKLRKDPEFVEAVGIEYGSHLDRGVRQCELDNLLRTGLGLGGSPGFIEGFVGVQNLPKKIQRRFRKSPRRVLDEDSPEEAARSFKTFGAVIDYIKGSKSR